jgi:hypothetical protein
MSVVSDDAASRITVLFFGLLTAAVTGHSLPNFDSFFKNENRTKLNI